MRRTFDVLDNLTVALTLRSRRVGSQLLVHQPRRHTALAPCCLKGFGGVVATSVLCNGWVAVSRRKLGSAKDGDRVY